MYSYILGPHMRRFLTVQGWQMFEGPVMADVWGPGWQVCKGPGMTDVHKAHVRPILEDVQGLPILKAQKWPIFQGPGVATSRRPRYGSLIDGPRISALWRPGRSSSMMSQQCPLSDGHGWPLYERVGPAVFQRWLTTPNHSCQELPTLQKVFC